MPTSIRLTPSQARRLILSSQGLIGKSPFKKGKRGVLEVLERLGYVQIDTISVVMRAHHHVFWTRVADYKPAFLDAVIKEQGAFEYWSHAAAYLPMRDFRFSYWRKNELREGKRKHWFEKDEAINAWVMEQIKEKGAMSSRDFDADPLHRSGPWWGWKPTKKALEQLFQEGHLIIKGRKNFQKIYDLPERSLQLPNDDTEVSTKEMARHLIFTTLEARGLASAEEIGYLRRNIKPAIKTELKALLESGEIVKVDFPSDEKYEAYALADFEARIPARIGTKKLHILSPFDNLVIQRKRLSRFFNFDYQIECYVPAPKRKFGYFSLPILYGDRMIGRMDSKADRKQKIFLIKNLSFEGEDLSLEGAIPLLVEKLHTFAQANGCKQIRLEDSNPSFTQELMGRYF